MAEQRTSRSRRKDDERDAREERPRERDGDGEEAEQDRQRSSRSARDGGLTAGRAARMGLREIADLTGRQPEGVTGVERTEDGWLVGVEVVEIRRVPSSADLLATYEADLDADGELVSYRRTRRYARGREDDGDS
jgi:Gas vesicle synthesis protein GvpO